MSNDFRGAILSCILFSTLYIANFAHYIPLITDYRKILTTEFTTLMEHFIFLTNTTKLLF